MFCTKWQVTIYNYQTNSVLHAHCKSEDDDLSERVLDKRAQFNWSFRMNFWHTTLFWCNFNSLNGHASFEVFWPENSLYRRCDATNCIWVAFNDAFYLINIQSRKLEFKHPWKKWIKISLTHFGATKPTFFSFLSCLIAFTCNNFMESCGVSLYTKDVYLSLIKVGGIFWNFIVLWMLII